MRQSNSHPEALAVLGGRQTHNPHEHLPERARVRVADLPCHLVGRERAGLEQLAGFPDAKPLAVLRTLRIAPSPWFSLGEKVL